MARDDQPPTGGFLADQFESPGVDIALARAMATEVSARLTTAMAKAVFIGREELERWVRTVDEIVEADTFEDAHDGLASLAAAMHTVLGDDD